MTVNQETSSVALEPRIALLAAVLGSAAFLAVLDGTAVTASLSTLATAFDTDLALVVWVTTGYLLAAGAVLPFVGWAVGRFGGRTTFLSGLAVFVLGSTLTGLAGDPASLIGFRVLQGIGGGLLEPASMMVAASLAPREHVGRVVGRFSMVINIAPVLGPLVGSVLADHGLWRWVFLINLPLGALIAVLALTLVPGGRGGDAAPPPDALGIALLSPGFVLALLAVNRWGEGGGGVLVIAAAAGAVLLLVGYVTHALRTPRAPVLDLRLLATPAYAAALLIMSGVGYVMFTQLSVLPLLAHDVFGLTGLARGAIVSALGAGLLVSMANAARISDRIGPRLPVLVGSLVGAAGLALMVLVHDSWPLAAVLAVYVVIGLGFGAVASPSFASVYRVLPAERAAQGTTALFVTVQLFASVGVTLTGLLLQRVAGDPYAVVFAVLAAVLLLAAVVGTRLPGRAA